MTKYIWYPQKMMCIQHVYFGYTLKNTENKKKNSKKPKIVSAFSNFDSRIVLVGNTELKTELFMIE